MRQAMGGQQVACVKSEIGVGSMRAKHREPLYSDETEREHKSQNFEILIF
jgi:hypothetical protein